MPTTNDLFRALRNADKAGDIKAAKRIAEMIKEQRDKEQQPALQQDSSHTLEYTPQPDSTNDKFLQSDPGWIESSKIIYRKNTGNDFVGTDEDAANYGIDQMGWFNYNLPAMAVDVNSLRSSSQEEKDAFLYLMDGYDNLGMSWNGTWRFLKGVATDPTTYVGLSTFGIGSIGSTTGRVLTKAGIKEVLRAGARAGAVTAIEGAIYGTADNALRQEAEIYQGRRKEYSYGDATTSAALGATLGGLLGAGIGGGASYLKGRFSKHAPIAEFAEDVTKETPPNKDVLEKSSEQLTSKEVKKSSKKTKEPIIDTQNAANGVDDVIKAIDLEVKKELKSGKPKTLIELEDIIKTIDSEVKKDLKANKSSIKSFSEAEKLLRDLNTTVPRTIKDGRQSLSSLTEATKNLSALIERASLEGGDLTDYLSKRMVTIEQLQGIKNAAQNSVDSLKRKLAQTIQKKNATKDPKKIMTFQEEVDALEEALIPVERLDIELSSQSGRDLRMRKGALNTGEIRNVTPKSLMERDGITSDAAENMYLDLLSRREKEVKFTGELEKIDSAISEAYLEKDYTKLQALKQERTKLLEEGSNAEENPRILKTFNKTMNVISELMVSMVFSPSTVIVNILPSMAKVIYKPFLDAFSKDPFSVSAYRGALANYSAMFSMIPGALKAAKMAFSFERGFLLADFNRGLEGEGPHIPDKFLGGYIRFFPRLLLASDEFFSQVSYKGFVLGQATADAYEEAFKKDLKGEKFTKFVKEYIEKRSENFFSKGADEEKRVVDMLLEEAKKSNVKNVDEWVKEQIRNNSPVFSRAKNRDGKTYIQDLLFKREFSDVGVASNAAKFYEGIIKNHPVVRVMGQLFFRTPVRVFEEGIRLTPGLNFISPKFIADLRGKNGKLRQVRAQGEALMSYAFAGTVLSMYGSGSITGGGPLDYKQRRQGENTGQFEPYTITLPNGDKWSYRNMDPLATPLKIMVNALDRYQMLSYRQAQGEHIHDTEWDTALAYFNVGTGAIAQAIRDASLTSGIDELVRIADMFSDGADTKELAVKYLGQKLSTLTPNTYYKVQLLSDPVLNDPATLEQFLLNRINKSDPSIPRMYTALGRPRSLSNPEAGLFTFSPSTPEERKRGIPEEELVVERHLWEMSQVLNVNFQAPYKNPLLGDVDLRTRMTKDGKEPLYNRWMRYTHESGVIDLLYDAVTNPNLPIGTPSSKSAKYTIVKTILSKYREAAFIKLMAEESNIDINFIERKERERRLKQGEKDFLNNPFE